MRVGSLCAGIGGADLALEALGCDIVWHAEIDRDASTVLAHHWPDVPNVGDITACDWSSVEPVDVIVAGYPCPPFSLAGRRLGADDERHLWPAVRSAVADLRPQWVLLENVRGHLTLGFVEVLADLAALGFDAEWGVLGSAAVGGCHRRERLWVAAADTDGNGRTSGGRWAGLVETDGIGSSTVTVGPSADDGPAADARRRPEWPESIGVGRGADPVVARLDRQAATAVDLLPTPTSRDHKGTNQRDDDTCLPGALLPTPTAWLGSRPVHADGDPARWDNAERSRELSDLAVHESFGRYAAAVDRWAALHGAPPAPTEPAPKAKAGRRLAAPFPEWMMGFPAGWVTDHVGRAAALRCIGNAIQPQTAVVAWSQLTARHRQAVAA